jgi:hypothetical protein
MIFSRRTSAAALLLGLGAETPLAEMMGENILYMHNLSEKLMKLPMIGSLRLSASKATPRLRKRGLEIIALP